MANKKRHREEEGMSEAWLIPYADILTLLLALFIVLFASSTIDVKKFTAMQESFKVIFNGGEGILDYTTMSENMSNNMININANQMTNTELSELKKQLDQYIRENDLNLALDTQMRTDSLVITIRDRVLFDSGSAVIKPEFIPTIDSIGNMLREYPEYEVVVSGHTDNVPINNAEFETNWDLSSKRALNFMKLLLRNENLDPKRFSAIGYGEYRPVATNDTAEGRMQNRRVEVTIKRAS